MNDAIRALFRTSLHPLLALVVASGCGRVSPRCDDPVWDPTDRNRSILMPDHSTVPMVLVPFGVTGATCRADATDTLANQLRRQNYTDVYFVCPGWHDRWESAVDWIRTFAEGYERARNWTATNAASKPAYKPLYVGVIWPMSVQNPVYPAFASDRRDSRLRPDVDRSAVAFAVDEELDHAMLERVIAELRSRGHDIRAGRLERLAERYATLTPPEQIDLADCVLPLYGPQGEPSAPGLRYAVTTGRPEVTRSFTPEIVGVILREPTPLPPIGADELLQVWKDSVRSIKRRPGEDAATKPAAITVGELFRWGMRATDLRVIKDRAYVVGANGLAELLRVVRDQSAARIHLVGQSFGAEAALSAAAAYVPPVDPTPPAVATPATTIAATAPATAPAAAPATIRPISSLLLLSSVVNHQALAGAPAVGMDVPRSLQSRARPGDYFKVIASPQVRSVVVLHSNHDWFNTVYAPLALRRPTFEGMASPDSWSAPGQGFATLGGAGPSGAEPPIYAEPLIAPGAGAAGPQRYLFPTSGVKLISIDGSDSIAAHGDANDRAIWWLFANQVGGE